MTDSPVLGDEQTDPRRVYGNELKRRRETAGLSQAELGRRVVLSPSMIAHVEAGRRRPRLDDAKRLDQALGTDGFFERFLPTLIVHRYVDYFSAAADAETRAVAISEFAAVFVPGILQVEDYARAALEKAAPNFEADEVDKHVVNRLVRSRILSKPDGPVVWVVLGEAVLRTVVGSRRVMAVQLRHIAQLGRSGRLMVQVVPFAAGAHPAMGSMVSLMRFTEEPEAAYVEALYTGSFVDDPAKVQGFKEAFDMARALGLPPGPSLDMIEQVAKEYDAP
ncbi:Helix-turn-helix domain-containing protein [Actinacidiphila alni]|uniref:Helix-turn-helix domain-containing protein n=1 Tax=Actinacidiphila alni TaxID=380248 RepID=A0A1I1YJJ8_9ACTN|nr:helix-turn-helix transcriptional regulator [Actinacidiphila alni]SFE19472.1 Helix-turn-helix domain-containing protein [Actinacidiphila alni]